MRLGNPPGTERRHARHHACLAQRGAGKSTLTAHLAGYAHSLGHRCLVIDADPQGSLSLWHSLRPNGEPPLCRARRAASTAPWPTPRSQGYEWVFIDTAPTMWLVVQEAIRAATLVIIPARPGFFDLNAVLETVKATRALNKPYAVALNAAPSKRDDREAPVMAQARYFLGQHGIPVWWGQISQRSGYALTPRRRRERKRARRGQRRGRGRGRGLCGRRSTKSVAAIDAAYAAAKAGAGSAGRAA